LTLTPEREYVKITKDYTLAAAKAFQGIPSLAENKDEPFRFIFVSAIGATHQPGAFTSAFARVKGETEMALAEMMQRTSAATSGRKFHAHSARPCWPDYFAHDAIKPYIPKQPLGLTALAWGLTPLVRIPGLGVKSYWNPTQQLGRTLTELAMGKWDGEMAKVQEGATGNGLERLPGGSTMLETTALRRFAGLD